MATKRKRKRNKKKKEPSEIVVPTLPTTGVEIDSLIIDDDADLSGDRMVADFELKLQQLEVLMLTNPKGEKLKPNASPSWIDGLKRK